MSHLPVGSLIDGRYTVLSRLGEGGMGVVYETRHEDMQRTFVGRVYLVLLAVLPPVAVIIGVLLLRVIYRSGGLEAMP